jgi:hypothetical protein
MDCIPNEMPDSAAKMHEKGEGEAEQEELPDPRS